MAAPAQLQLLAPLLVEQQGVQQGAPGGLVQPMDPAARTEGLRFAEKSRPKNVSTPALVAPDAQDAHGLMSVHITRLMNRLIASKYFFKEYEALALDWLEDQFQDRAAVQFRLVLKEAKRVATTSGIGQNSVVYRVLRDMLLEYPAHGVKANILLKRKELLVWSSHRSVAQIHVDWMAFYEMYDRAVTLTHNLDDVTLIVLAQDWATRFTEMQEFFPSWVTALITNFPARFTSMKTCWTAINAEAMRQAASRKSASSGRVLQLTDHMMAGAMEAYVDDSTVFIDDASQGAGLCAMGRTPGCWRCGSAEHLRRECPQPASDQERQGKHTWAKQPGRVTPAQLSGGTPGMWPSRGQGAVTVASPTVAQMATLTSRIDRQEAMFETVLERLAATLPTTSAQNTESGVHQAWGMTSTWVMLRR